MKKTATDDRLVIDRVNVNSLVPNNNLGGIVTIFLDEAGRPIQIEKERRSFFGKLKVSNLKPSYSPFSEEFIIGYLVSKGVSKQDYERYIKPNINYGQYL